LWLRRLGQADADCRDGKSGGASQQPSFERAGTESPGARILRRFGSEAAAQGMRPGRKTAKRSTSGTVRAAHSCSFAGVAQKPLNRTEKREVTMARGALTSGGTGAALCWEPRAQRDDMKNFVDFFNYYSTFLIFRMV
jgi:hypothetical protein